MIRQSTAPCPGCREALPAIELAVCRACRGAWASEPDLEERVQAIRGKSELRLEMVYEPAPLARGGRRCPRCRGELTPQMIGDVEVDRCDQRHGVWFDAEELARMLVASRDGAGVQVREVELGPRERAALEEIRSAGPDSELTAVDGLDLINIIAAAIAWIFD
jgi:Zn-finger nucleic acid-binding protein